MTVDKIIIGAGLYGLYAAQKCGAAGQRVLVLERDPAPFMRATYINQARVHMGYHYPRSYSTAIKSAAYAVVYVVSFLLLLILLRLALTPLHLFTKLPVVHGVNAVLGGALGLVKGALLLFLVVWALQKWQLFITPEMVEKSFLLKFFAANSPMDLIAKL